jgi:signal transduction histidine kinase
VTALGKLLRTTVFKLSLAYLVIFAIGCALLLARVGFTARFFIDEQIASTIDADINGLSESYSQGGIRRLVDAVERRSRQPGSSLYLVTTFAGERIVGNVSEISASALSGGTDEEITYQRVGGEGPTRLAVARVYVLPGGFRLLVGRDLEEREALRRALLRTLITSLVWLTVIGVLGGAFVAVRVLRRVDAMNESARNIMEGDLSRRLPLAGTGDELDRLAINLNAMLDRIADLMIGLREVSDNIAHDLKTPLTRLRNRADEALLGSSNDDDRKAALEKIIAESDGLIRTFDALLMIARLEAGSITDGATTFDIDAVVADLVELYEPSAEEQDMPLVYCGSPGLAISGNRELVVRSLANLIDNALKYGKPVSEHSTVGEKGIDVSARHVGDAIEIEVADHGSGIPDPKDRARVLDRFVRLETSRSAPGAGLGLSLVAAVAHLHKGSLRLEENAPGLRAILSLPAANLMALPAPDPTGLAAQ